MMDVNTVSIYPTHFLRGVELVKKAREEFGVASENWTSPTEYKFGIPNDNYYAEIWSDGMDWQTSYWVIEEKNLEKPQIQPFIIFNNHEEEMLFNRYDFKTLIHAALHYRRDHFWIKKKDLAHYTDSIWPFINLFKNEVKYKETKLYAFQHASQERVVFWMNTDFIPEGYREKNRDYRNKAERYADGSKVDRGEILVTLPGRRFHSFGRMP